MAIQTGAIKYRGSFKSIRNYVTLHDVNTYAGEKGGANRDLIMNNPAFVRTRENMTEFGGCGVIVKALRRGFMNLLPEQSDKGFTGRLMSIVKLVNTRDIEGVKGKRSIIFSATRPTLLTLIFNVLENIADKLVGYFVCSHPVSRAEATVKITDMVIKPVLVPEGATHYRVQNHLSIISDYSYSEINRRYEPISPLNALSAFKYSEYTKVDAALTAEVVASFPAGTTPDETDTVIQCVGIEFYVKSGADLYLPLKGSSMKVTDVF
jgi:hypothetical protein